MAAMEVEDVPTNDEDVPTKDDISSEEDESDDGDDGDGATDISSEEDASDSDGSEAEVIGSSGAANPSASASVAAAVYRPPEEEEHDAKDDDADAEEEEDEDGDTEMKDMTSSSSFSSRAKVKIPELFDVATAKETATKFLLQKQNTDVVLADLVFLHPLARVVKDVVISVQRLHVTKAEAELLADALENPQKWQVFVDQVFVQQATDEMRSALRQLELVTFSVADAKKGTRADNLGAGTWRVNGITYKVNQQAAALMAIKLACDTAAGKAGTVHESVHSANQYLYRHPNSLRLLYRAQFLHTAGNAEQTAQLLQLRYRALEHYLGWIQSPAWNANAFAVFVGEQVNLAVVQQSYGPEENSFADEFSKVGTAPRPPSLRAGDFQEADVRYIINAILGAGRGANDDDDDDDIPDIQHTVSDRFSLSPGQIAMYRDLLGYGHDAKSEDDIDRTIAPIVWTEQPCAYYLCPLCSRMCWIFYDEATMREATLFCGLTHCERVGPMHDVAKAYFTRYVHQKKVIDDEGATPYPVWGLSEIDRAVVSTTREARARVGELRAQLNFVFRVDFSLTVPLRDEASLSDRTRAIGLIGILRELCENDGEVSAARVLLASTITSRTRVTVNSGTTQVLKSKSGSKRFDPPQKLSLQALAAVGTLERYTQMLASGGSKSTVEEEGIGNRTAFALQASAVTTKVVLGLPSIFLEMLGIASVTEESYTAVVRAIENSEGKSDTARECYVSAGVIIACKIIVELLRTSRQRLQDIDERRAVFNSLLSAQRVAAEVQTTLQSGGLFVLGDKYADNHDRLYELSQELVDLYTGPEMPAAEFVTLAQQLVKNVTGHDLPPDSALTIYNEINENNDHETDVESRLQRAHNTPLIGRIVERFLNVLDGGDSGVVRLHELQIDAYMNALYRLSGASGDPQAVDRDDFLKRGAAFVRNRVTALLTEFDVNDIDIGTSDVLSSSPASVGGSSADVDIDFAGLTSEIFSKEQFKRPYLYASSAEKLGAFDVSSAQLRKPVSVSSKGGLAGVANRRAEALFNDRARIFAVGLQVADPLPQTLFAGLPIVTLAHLRAAIYYGLRKLAVSPSRAETKEMGKHAENVAAAWHRVFGGSRAPKEANESDKMAIDGESNEKEEAKIVSLRTLHDSIAPRKQEVLSRSVLKTSVPALPELLQRQEVDIYVDDRKVGSDDEDEPNARPEDEDEQMDTAVDVVPDIQSDDDDDEKKKQKDEQELELLRDDEEEEEEARDTTSAEERSPYKRSLHAFLRQEVSARDYRIAAVDRTARWPPTEKESVTLQRTAALRALQRSNLSQSFVALAGLSAEAWHFHAPDRKARSFFPDNLKNVPASLLRLIVKTGLAVIELLPERHKLRLQFSQSEGVYDFFLDSVQCSSMTRFHQKYQNPPESKRWTASPEVRNVVMDMFCDPDQRGVPFWDRMEQLGRTPERYWFFELARLYDFRGKYLPSIERIIELGARYAYDEQFVHGLFCMRQISLKAVDDNENEYAEGSWLTASLASYFDSTVYDARIKALHDKYEQRRRNEADALEAVSSNYRSLLTMLDDVQKYIRDLAYRRNPNDTPFDVDKRREVTRKRSGTEKQKLENTARTVEQLRNARYRTLAGGVADPNMIFVHWFDEMTTGDRITANTITIEFARKARRAMEEIEAARKMVSVFAPGMLNAIRANPSQWSAELDEQQLIEDVNSLKSTAKRKKDGEIIQKPGQPRAFWKELQTKYIRMRRAIRLYARFIPQREAAEQTLENVRAMARQHTAADSRGPKFAIGRRRAHRKQLMPWLRVVFASSPIDEAELAVEAAEKLYLADESDEALLPLSIFDHIFKLDARRGKDAEERAYAVPLEAFRGTSVSSRLEAEWVTLVGIRVLAIYNTVAALEAIEDDDILSPILDTIPLKTIRPSHVVLATLDLIRTNYPAVVHRLLVTGVLGTKSLTDLLERLKKGENAHTTAQDITRFLVEYESVHDPRTLSLVSPSGFDEPSMSLSAVLDLSAVISDNEDRPHALPSAAYQRVEEFYAHVKRVSAESRNESEKEKSETVVERDAAKRVFFPQLKVLRNSTIDVATSTEKAAKAYIDLDQFYPELFDRRIGRTVIHSKEHSEALAKAAAERKAAAENRDADEDKKADPDAMDVDDDEADEQSQEEGSGGYAEHKYNQLLGVFKLPANAIGREFAVNHKKRLAAAVKRNNAATPDTPPEVITVWTSARVLEKENAGADATEAIDQKDAYSLTCFALAAVALYNNGSRSSISSSALSPFRPGSDVGLTDAIGIMCDAPLLALTAAGSVTAALDSATAYYDADALAGVKMAAIGTSCFRLAAELGDANVKASIRYGDGAIGNRLRKEMEKVYQSIVAQVSAVLDRVLHDNAAQLQNDDQRNLLLGLTLVTVLLNRPVFRRLTFVSSSQMNSRLAVVLAFSPSVIAQVVAMEAVANVSLLNTDADGLLVAQSDGTFQRNVNEHTLKETFTFVSHVSSFLEGVLLACHSGPVMATLSNLLNRSEINAVSNITNLLTSSLGELGHGLDAMLTATAVVAEAADVWKEESWKDADEKELLKEAHRIQGMLRNNDSYQTYAERTARLLNAWRVERRAMRIAGRELRGVLRPENRTYEEEQEYANRFERGEDSEEEDQDVRKKAKLEAKEYQESALSRAVTLDAQFQVYGGTLGQIVERLRRLPASQTNALSRVSGRAYLPFATLLRSVARFAQLTDVVRFQQHVRAATAAQVLGARAVSTVNEQHKARNRKWREKIRDAEAAWRAAQSELQKLRTLAEDIEPLKRPSNEDLRAARQKVDQLHAKVKEARDEEPHIWDQDEEEETEPKAVADLNSDGDEDETDAPRAKRARKYRHSELRWAAEGELVESRFTFAQVVHTLETERRRVDAPALLAAFEDDSTIDSAIFATTLAARMKLLSPEVTLPNNTELTTVDTNEDTLLRMFAANFHEYSYDALIESLSLVLRGGRGSAAERLRIVKAVADHYREESSKANAARYGRRKRGKKKKKRPEDTEEQAEEKIVTREEKQAVLETYQLRLQAQVVLERLGQHDVVAAASDGTSVIDLAAKSAREAKKLLQDWRWKANQPDTKKREQARLALEGIKQAELRFSRVGTALDAPLNIERTLADLLDPTQTNCLLRTQYTDEINRMLRTWAVRKAVLELVSLEFSPFQDIKKARDTLVEFGVFDEDPSNPELEPLDAEEKAARSASRAGVVLVRASDVEQLSTEALQTAESKRNAAEDNAVAVSFTALQQSLMTIRETLTRLQQTAAQATKRNERINDDGTAIERAINFEEAADNVYEIIERMREHKEKKEEEEYDQAKRELQSELEDQLNDGNAVRWLISTWVATNLPANKTLVEMALRDVARGVCDINIAQYTQKRKREGGVDPVVDSGAGSESDIYSSSESETGSSASSSESEEDPEDSRDLRELVAEKQAQEKAEAKAKAEAKTNVEEKSDEKKKKKKEKKEKKKEKKEKKEKKKEKKEKKSDTQDKKRTKRE